MTWPEVASRVQDPGLLVVVPLGAQHGPHLPLGTDTAIAVALAERLAAVRPDPVVAPAIPFGSSGEHGGFPGTLSIGQAALEALVVELVRSAGCLSGVILVSGHGGNAEPLARAVRTLMTEGRRVLVWAPAGTGETDTGRWDLHAGWGGDLGPSRPRCSRGSARPGGGGRSPTGAGDRPGWGGGRLCQRWRPRRPRRCLLRRRRGAPRRHGRRSHRRGGRVAPGVGHGGGRGGSGSGGVGGLPLPGPAPG